MRKVKIFIIAVVTCVVLSAQPVAVYADVLPVLSDQGLPFSEDDIFVWSENGRARTGLVADQTAPEGVSYTRLTNGATWKGWGVFFCGRTGGCTKDLSRFRAGNGQLEFYLRSTLPLRIELEGPSLNNRAVTVGSTGGNWQKITLPLSQFDGVDFTKIYGAFKITAENTAEVDSWDVDNIRWTVPLPSYPDSTEITFTNGQMRLNGEAFFMRGVAGEFTPVGKFGPAYLWSEFPGQYEPDIPLLTDLGANTMRVYQPPSNRAFLDAMHAAGIRVIVGYPVWTKLANGSFVDFSNPMVRANNVERFKDMIRDWNGHPAVISWVIGNEVNINTDPNKLADWYSLVEEMAQAGKALEETLPNKHFITVANAEIQDVAVYDAAVPSLDAWTVHIYRGPSFGTAFSDYQAVSDKPLILGEFGSDAYDNRINQEAPTLQADILEDQWNELLSHIRTDTNNEPLIGTLVFSWRDGWWKTFGPGSGDNTHEAGCDWQSFGYDDPCMDEEWWGLVAISGDPASRSPREAYERLRTLWNPNTFIRGDFDCSGEVKVQDVIASLIYMFKAGDGPACLDTVDANDDGELDISDPVRMLFHVFEVNGGVDLPDPHPAPGIDPTPDDISCAVSCPAP